MRSMERISILRYKMRTYMISGKKGYPTHNVFAAYMFDLEFTYVLPDREGFAYNSRIVKNALTREDKLLIPPGNFKEELYYCPCNKFYQ